MVSIMGRDEAAARAAFRAYLEGEIGWSVQRLADEAGVDYDTAYALQDPKGTRWPRQTNQRKLERALGLPEGTIERVAMGAPIPAPVIHTSPDGLALRRPEQYVIVGIDPAEAAQYTEAELEEVAAAATLAARRAMREVKSHS